ncbi:hypothetical protein PSE10B_11820 [Pseudomonas amygdali pv. eriobotryae]|nr:hypothetical protein PSE10B_11820 [Pseudomonas amygdali pv. eriobotryae]
MPKLRLVKKGTGVWDWASPSPNPPLCASLLFLLRRLYLRHRQRILNGGKAPVIGLQWTGRNISRQIRFVVTH